MTLARTDAFDDRAAIYRRLARRNVGIGVLRLAVPLLGVAVFLILVGQIYLSGLMRQYGVSGIRIERGDAVVETPQYAGTGANGARYLVTAREARAPLDLPEEIAMSDAKLDYGRPGESNFHAEAAEATMNTRTQQVAIPGRVAVYGDDGMHGTLDAVTVAMDRDVTTADGPVDITLGDGTLITGSAMVYDGTLNLWTFTDATVIVSDLPEAEEP